MGINELRRELKIMDKDKLIDLIIDLYKKNKLVKEFFDFYVNPHYENELLENYKNKVYRAFYPRGSYDYNLKDAKKAISDFKKLGTSPKLLADLMLFYVETGVKYTNDFGDINEAFYYSLEATFHDALTLMKKENILDDFKERARKVVDDTSGIGWGFHDYLYDVWTEFYSTENNENL